MIPKNDHSSLIFCGFGASLIARTFLLGWVQTILVNNVAQVLNTGLQEKTFGLVQPQVSYTQFLKHFVECGQLARCSSIVGPVIRISSM